MGTKAMVEVNMFMLRERKIKSMGENELKTQHSTAKS